MPAWNWLDSETRRMLEMNDAMPSQGTGMSVGQATPTTNWILPVAGMRGAPGDRSQGGNWARGSFGYRKPASKGGHTHTGTDIYADAGSSIVTPVAGTITSVGYGSESGYHVRIRGTDGIDYYFAHMQEKSQWSQGAKVNAGIHIGFVGNSGNASGTSPHLHFGMKKNGKAISPNDFLETGTQQKHTPLSALPGLNTPEEVARWVKEELARQSAAYGEMKGFNTGSIPGMIQQGQMDASGMMDEGFGQRFLGSTLDAHSRAMLGGRERTPIPRVGAQADVSSALSATEGGVPEADPTNPVVGRMNVDNTEEVPDARG